MLPMKLPYSIATLTGTVRDSDPCLENAGAECQYGRTFAKRSVCKLLLLERPNGALREIWITRGPVQINMLQSRHNELGSRAILLVFVDASNRPAKSSSSCGLMLQT